MQPCRTSVFWGALGGLVSTVLTWSFFHFYVSPRGAAELDLSAAYDATQTGSFFEFQGQSVAAAELPEELKLNFERAYHNRKNVRRDADLQFYKELDKISRLYALNQYVATGTSEQGKSSADIEAALLPFAQANERAARQLYEASDPSAPRSGFAPVRGQLVGYLNEVRRRETLETWSNSLRQAGELKLTVERPTGLLDLSALAIDGWPRETNDQANAIVFVDYLCEGCVPALVDLAQTLQQYHGVVNPVYVPFPYTQPEVSMGLARASLCAHQLGKFSSFHMAALTKGDLLARVSVFDLIRQSDVSSAAFRSCWRSGEGLSELLGRAQGLARATGLMQTPALVFRGRLFEGPKFVEELDMLLKESENSAQLTKYTGGNKSH